MSSSSSQNLPWGNARADTAPPTAGGAPAPGGRPAPDGAARGGTRAPVPPPRPAPAGAPHRPRVLELGLLLLAATGLGCVGLSGALDGTWWVPSAAATAVTVLLVTGAARLLRLPSVLVTVLGLAALLLALTLLHLSDHALLGFIPTSATFDAAAQLWHGSAEFVSREAAPFGAHSGLSFVVSLLVGLVAVFMETALVGLRTAGLACLGVLALLVVPALTLPGSVSAPGLAAAALAALALLAGSRAWGATRDERIAPAPGGLPRALLVVAGVLVVVLLVPTAMPGFFNGAFPQGSSLTSERASGVGPLRAVGQELRSPGQSRRFSYTTSTGQAQHMRLLTLSDFSQDEWFPGTADLDEDFSSLGAAAREAVPHGNEVTSKITLGDFTEHWLPSPYAPVDVAGLGEEGWGWSPRDLSVHSAATGMSGASYTVTSLLPDVTADALRRAPSSSSDDAMAEYLRLPPNRPQAVADAARRFTDGARTDYDRALAIQNRLRSDFRYDVNTPLAEGYDAGGLDSLERFMQTRAGYSGHFAPAMALMAREMGIPARVAVGYLPTTAPADAADGASFTVTSGDAHAWPELYFRGTGWVRFEPTPGVPSTPGYAPDAGREPSGGTAESPSPSASQPEDAGQTPPEESSSAQPPSEQEPEPSESSPQQDQPQDQQPAGPVVPWWLVLALVLVPLLLVLAVLPRWLRGRRRRARVAALRDGSLPPQRRANAAWDELRALAEDYGGGARPSDTPRVQARRIAAGIPAAQPAVDRVVADLESASYGAPSAQWRPQASVEDLARIRDELHHRASRGERLRATWWPPSLRSGAGR